jgi:hypothetical protein
VRIPYRCVELHQLIYGISGSVKSQNSDFVPVEKLLKRSLLFSFYNNAFFKSFVYIFRVKHSYSLQGV